LKRNISPLVAAITLAGLLVARGQTSEPKVGEQPPPLELKVLLQAQPGTKASWDALKGKVVVLEFWATWCGPCVAAISHLNELADHFKDRPVQFIAITDEDENIISPFLKKKPIHAWVGLDTDKSMFRTNPCSRTTASAVFPTL
jgi:thiol-disulfide isomerase/thioredoxin